VPSRMKLTKPGIVLTTVHESSMTLLRHTWTPMAVYRDTRLEPI